MIPQCSFCTDDEVTFPEIPEGLLRARIECECGAVFIQEQVPGFAALGRPAPGTENYSGW